MSLSGCYFPLVATVSAGAPRSDPAARTVVLLSTTALVTAVVLAITLHELAHVVADLAYGSPAVLLPNAVDAVERLTSGQQAVVAITGPVASLALGLALYAAQLRLQPGYGRLLLLWLALTSAQTGFGYFIVAAVLPLGDTGRAFQEWGVPPAGYVVAAVLGVVGQLSLSALTAREVSPWFDRATDVRRWVLLPWVLSTVVLLLLYAAVSIGTVAPEAVVAVLAGVGTATIFLPTTTFFTGRFGCGRRTIALGSPVAPVVGAAAVAAAIVVLAAVDGITIG